MNELLEELITVIAAGNINNVMRFLTDNPKFSEEIVWDDFKEQIKNKVRRANSEESSKTILLALKLVLAQSEKDISENENKSNTILQPLKDCIKQQVTIQADAKRDWWELIKSMFPIIPVIAGGILNGISSFTSISNKILSAEAFLATSITLLMATSFSYIFDAIDVRKKRSLLSQLKLAETEQDRYFLGMTVSLSILGVALMMASCITLAYGIPFAASVCAALATLAPFALQSFVKVPLDRKVARRQAIGVQAISTVNDIDESGREPIQYLSELNFYLDVIKMGREKNQAIATNAKLSKKIDKIKTQNEDLREKLQLKVIKSAAAASTAEIGEEDLEEQSEATNQVQTAAEDEKKNLQGQLEAAEKAKATAEDEKKNLQGQLEVAEKAKATAEDEKKNLQGQLADKTAALATAVQEKTDIEKENKGLKQELKLNEVALSANSAIKPTAATDDNANIRRTKSVPNFFSFWKKAPSESTKQSGAAQAIQLDQPGQLSSEQSKKDGFTKGPTK